MHTDTEKALNLITRSSWSTLRADNRDVPITHLKLHQRRLFTAGMEWLEALDAEASKNEANHSTLEELTAEPDKFLSIIDSTCGASDGSSVYSTEDDVEEALAEFDHLLYDC